MRRRVLTAWFAAAWIAAFSGCAGHGATPGTSLLPDALGPHTSPSTATEVVTTLRDSGNGSLRHAIAAANAANPGVSTTISFKVHGTIVLGSALPAIAVPVSIDGRTAPKYAGKGPVVTIDANHRGGLVFAAGSAGSKLLAIAVGNAKGNGVTLEDGSIVLDLDYVGVNAAGRPFGNAGDGVYVAAQSSQDAIGENPSGVAGAVSNVISSNAGNGISLHGSSNITIAANRIGADPSGRKGAGNARNGIWITAASTDNEIGGTVYTDSVTGRANNPTGSKGTTKPVFVVPPDGNQISANGGDGVRLDDGSKDNVLNGNFIGTTADGDAGLGNGGDGVAIHGADDNTLAGCKFVNNPFVYYNVMSGNGKNGLHVTNSNGTIVQGNFFGIGANNRNIVANRGDGILIDGSSANTQVGGVIPLGNVSAGNLTNGIEVSGTASGFITFNTFGGLLAFKGAAPNKRDGLLITATGGNQTVRTNVFSGNRKNGIEIGGDASGVSIDPDIVGLNTKGDGTLANGGDGVLIGGTAHDITLGGYTQSVIPQSTFSGNGGFGIDVTESAHDVDVIDSFVGTDVLGTMALANARGGIRVADSATKIVIGGTSANANKPKKNIVSGNGGPGISVLGGTSYIGVVGNWIGIGRTGKKPILNQGKPLVVSPGSTHDTIENNVTKPIH